MSFLQRLLGTGSDPREELRPLWHAVVAHSRNPKWYAKLGVADSVAGRFDMITAIAALTLLRLEAKPELAKPAALLTELFVEDMDGQLRESGVGDVVVGKRMGKLVSVLGGRLGAYREAFESEDPALLDDAIARNVTLLDNTASGPLAAELRALHGSLAAKPDAEILKGDIA